MTDKDRIPGIKKVLDDLHLSYLHTNEYDEGDLIFYRINYHLEETFGVTRQEAARLHELYHEEKPRHISKGFCERCSKVVGIIPIIYGIQESDMEEMRRAENEGRLIIGDMAGITMGRTAMFGCKVCKSPLPKYGNL